MADHIWKELLKFNRHRTVLIDARIFLVAMFGNTESTHESVLRRQPLRIRYKLLIQYLDTVFALKVRILNTSPNYRLSCLFIGLSVFRL